jgi:hypothetical protein
MVKVMTKQFQNKDTYPNHTLSAEWDIIAEMKTIIAKEDMWHTIQFCHIKDHADKHKTYDQLTLQQQLNVDADKLVGAYIQTHEDDQYSIAPLLPTSGAQLKMKGGTVTHQLKQTVTQARSKQIHKQYLCKKNNWTPTDFQTIDWESHCQALNQIPAKRTILIKYLNNIAPVGKIVHKYNPKYTAGCPSCTEAMETQEHMLQCPCEKREEWQLRTIQNITAILSEYQTPETMQQVMLDVIRHSFGHPAPDDQNTTTMGTTLVTAQAAIG